MAQWLLLHYDLPAKPSRQRVYIWRKLKALGAVLLQGSLWVLPETAQTTEHFRWLLTEIQEMHGEAALWRSNLLLGIQEADLIRKFQDQAEAQYNALLKRLNAKNPDLGEIARQYQQIARKDYFGSQAGPRVRQRLTALRGRSA